MDYSVIKEGDLFLLTEKNGDVVENDQRGYGLYTKDTRFLSQMEYFIDGVKPTLLSSDASKSFVAEMHLMNVEKDKGAIELKRTRFIQAGVLYEEVAFTNDFLEVRSFDFTALFDADFQDMFIVRNYREGKVGEKLASEINDQGLLIRYQGYDEVVRESKINWDVKQDYVADNKVHFSFELKPKETKTLTFTVVPVIDGEGGKVTTFAEALSQLEGSYRQWNEEITKVDSDLKSFDQLYQRGVKDLRMLMTDIGYGDVPVAGLPWFAVPFGRDSLITSLFMLPLNPEKVKGTLATLAAYQGEKVDKWRDEEPGKIMHEIRFGELAATNQSPFTPYYGSVDATPLFLVLIGEYYRWTGDLGFVEELIPNIKRAFEWIDSHQDFVTYHQEAEKGFPNQGWKDSSNSIVHQHGAYAKSPIALSEVQGYVYQAKKSLAPIFAQLGDNEGSQRLNEEAEKLRQKVEDLFWMDEEKFYAIALDKDKQKVESVTSNPGHMLLSGLPSVERANMVADRLVSEDVFNGYGIRTMSTQATGYYPVSYHNGSVWPHDNAMILLGLSRQGYSEQANLVLSSLLDASKHFDYQRLPELFCGHDGKIGYPVPYPTTCSPQAWSAGIAVTFIQVVLGLNPDATNQMITINPALPDTMNRLQVSDLRIGHGTLSLVVTRKAADLFETELIENTTGFKINQVKEHAIN